MLTDYIIILPSNSMQVLQSVYKINEEQSKDNLLSIVSDRYCRTILKSVLDKPKSAMEIASETKTPISTVYRRLQTLQDNKLLRISGMISDDGKRLFLYRSKIRGIKSNYDDGQVEVELILNNN